MKILTHTLASMMLLMTVVEASANPFQKFDGSWKVEDRCDCCSCVRNDHVFTIDTKKMVMLEPDPILSNPDRINVFPIQNISTPAQPKFMIYSAWFYELVNRCSIKALRPNQETGYNVVGYFYRVVKDESGSYVRATGTACL